MDSEPDPGPLGQPYKRESSSRGYTARLRAKMLQLRSKRGINMPWSLSQVCMQTSTMYIIYHVLYTNAGQRMDLMDT